MLHLMLPIKLTFLIDANCNSSEPRHVTFLYITQKLSFQQSTLEALATFNEL